MKKEREDEEGEAMKKEEEEEEEKGEAEMGLSHSALSSNGSTPFSETRLLSPERVGDQAHTAPEGGL